MTTDPDGSQRETTIWFVLVDSELYVRAVRVSRWGDNVASRPDVRLRLGGEEFAARAEPVSDEETVRAVVEAVEEKYTDSNWWAQLLRAALGGIDVFRLRPAVPASG